MKDSLEGSGGREVSSTMAFVRILTVLLKQPRSASACAIIPDEARTFGMDGLFASSALRQPGPALQTARRRRVAVLQGSEGRPDSGGRHYRSGSMASFTAAGTSYANYGVEMIPFFIYYSMFGFQRVGDAIWAFADSREGFLCGGTAGRTTLSGEGLQQPGMATVSCMPAPSPPAPPTIRRTPTRSRSSCKTAFAALGPPLRMAASHSFRYTA